MSHGIAAMKLDRRELEAFSDAAGVIAVDSGHALPRVEQRHIDRFKQLKAERSATRLGPIHGSVHASFCTPPRLAIAAAPIVD